MVQASIKKLEEKVRENERRLLDKCEKKECKKISKKIKKVDKRFQIKFEIVSSNIGEINLLKRICSTIFEN